MADIAADIERAQDAIAHRRWSEAYQVLTAMEPSSLGGGDLADLAEAAWWCSAIGEAIEARRRAYAAFAAAGDQEQAGYMAVRLCIDHFERGEPSVGSGWFKRAHDHLLDRARSVPYGFLLLIEATMALQGDEVEAAAATARRACAIGHGSGAADLVAMATVREGTAIMAAGDIDAGLKVLDEAMTAVIADELSPYFTGAVYCSVIEACLDVMDLRRASEWNEAARVWCESLPPESPYPGQCRVFRAELARLQGDFPKASLEAARATEELAQILPLAAATAQHTLGRVQTILGRFGHAEASFGRALELGGDAQPGLALLRLAQGDGAAARTALRPATNDSGTRLTHRAELLAVLIDAELAGGDEEAASAVCHELAGIAVDFPTTALLATTSTARGSLALASNAISEALEQLWRANALWRELKLPYETARARVRYGLALRSAGNNQDATLEFRAAHGIFERLGAASDATRVAELLGDRPELPGGLTSREAEVLHLVATGKTNRDVAVELVISEHTVARHIQNMYAKLGVSSRAAATAYAFEHGLA